MLYMNEKQRNYLQDLAEFCFLNSARWFPFSCAISRFLGHERYKVLRFVQKKSCNKPGGEEMQKDANY